jgi:RNA polymerase sigma-70 factor (ECF subfamily)
LTHQQDALSRAEISRRLNLSSAAVAMSIHRMRRRYGELLRQEVAATVDDPADVEDELRTLMAIISRAP